MYKIYFFPLPILENKIILALSGKLHSAWYWHLLGKQIMKMPRPNG